VEFNVEVKLQTQNKGETTVNMLIKSLRIFHHMAGPFTTRTYVVYQESYRISRPIRHTFFPGKFDLNLTCILSAEGKYYFQTYKYL